MNLWIVMLSSFVAFVFCMDNKLVVATGNEDGFCVVADEGSSMPDQLNDWESCMDRDNTILDKVRVKSPEDVNPGTNPDSEDGEEKLKRRIREVLDGVQLLDDELEKLTPRERRFREVDEKIKRRVSLIAEMKAGMMKRWWELSKREKSNLEEMLWKEYLAAMGEDFKEVDEC